MSVTIFHNPGCGTSSNTLAVLEAAGLAPRVVEYLQTPPSPPEIVDLARRAGVPLRALIRRRGTPFDQLGLGDPGMTDADLLDAIAAHPILLNRPIVVTDKAVALCRPSDAVLDMIEAPTPDVMRKADGAPLVTVRPLAEAEAARNALAAAGLPVDGIEGAHVALFEAIDSTRARVGFGALEGKGPDLLLRSIVIVPERRGQGLGAPLVHALERAAARRGAERLHLLTDTAPFFETAGFGRADRMSAPQSIAATAEFSTLCPASAVYLTRPVRTDW